MSEYRPKPLDTSNIQLDAAQLRLIDLLARNAHEVWAAKRMSDGWTVGAHRDDASKQHPGLVSYEALPQSEKVYNREIVEQTIKGALALGYKISKS